MTLNTHPTVVERGLRLSQSFIWKLQTRFYESLGIEAWLSGTIPSRITTNSFIARRYAQLIAAYLNELDGENVTILELGAGHGRFGFLCAKHLDALTQANHLRAKKWTYVLTDVAERNIDFWRGHAAFRPLVERGLVDFARYEAGADNSLRLRESGRNIGGGEPAEHLVVVGNYFFDSLPIDVWMVEQGRLKSALPVLTLPPGASHRDPTDAAILEQLELDWELHHDEPRYDCPIINDVVEHFRGQLKGSFTIPVGALGTLSTLESWSKNGLLLLAADKGYVREEDLRDRPLPTMVRHGCFSFSLNFCALKQWFERRGGTALLPSFRDASLEVAAFTTRTSPQPASALRFLFNEQVADFSPGDFYELTHRLGRDDFWPDLRQCLSFIRLSCFDPRMFHALRRPLRRQLAGAPDSDLEAVRETLARVAELYFHLEDCDVPFALGRVYQQLGDYAEAVHHYRDSLRWFGDDTTCLFNLAECLQRQGSVEEASACSARGDELLRVGSAL